MGWSMVEQVQLVQLVCLPCLEKPPDMKENEDADKDAKQRKGLPDNCSDDQKDRNDY
jgi:hypothetical protein